MNRRARIWRAMLCTLAGLSLLDLLTPASLDQPLSSQDAQEVSLAFAGRGPDLGAYERGSVDVPAASARRGF
jgi:hypothetical protein